MPLHIIRNDITKMDVDAIVNPTDSQYSGGGGVDREIHRTAGSKLDDCCRTLEPCKVGCSVITKGYDLPCSYIIHTVGPVYFDGSHEESQLLRNCYTNVLHTALNYRCHSIAIPVISGGTFCYPKEEAIAIGRDTIISFLKTHDMHVYFVVYDDDSFRISRNQYALVKSYLDDHYEVIETFNKDVYETDATTLQEALSKQSETFSMMLLRKIDEAGMKDSECYHRANIDRKLFSKIRNDIHYHPKKQTVLAFAIALKLTLPETEELLKTAGFALSHASSFDIIIEYFIVHHNYDIFELNETLFSFDQPILGS